LIDVGIPQVVEALLGEAYIAGLKCQVILWYCLSMPENDCFIYFVAS